MKYHIYICHLKFSRDIAAESITMSQELHNTTPFFCIRIRLLMCCITIFNSAKVNLIIKAIKNTISCVFKCYVKTWPRSSLGFWTFSPDDLSR